MQTLSQDINVKKAKAGVKKTDKFQNMQKWVKERPGIEKVNKFQNMHNSVKLGRGAENRK